MLIRRIVRSVALPAVVGGMVALLPTAALATPPLPSALVSVLGATCEEEPCPDLEIELRQVDGAGAPTSEPVPAGAAARLELVVWNAGSAPALDVHVEITLPQGIGWSIEAPGALSCSSSAGPGEPVIFSCTFGTLAPGTFEDAVAIVASGTTDLDDCGDLSAAGATHASNAGDDRPTAAVTFQVECPPPTLAIDKSADASAVAITGPPDNPVVTPSIVTWTLSYTLTGAGASNVTISDALPPGLTFVDASDGGILADGAVHWTLPSVRESGSVTLRTTVDPATISRLGPTVNVAVIDSDETEAAEGAASISVTVEPPPLGGNPLTPPRGGGAAAPHGPVATGVVPDTAVPVVASEGLRAINAWVGVLVLSLAAHRALVRRARDT